MTPAPALPPGNGARRRCAEIRLHDVSLPPRFPAATPPYPAIPLQSPGRTVLQNRSDTDCSNSAGSGKFKERPA